ncbi:hypothetical protein ASPZODRAFT_1945060 [Penicilliopsis zonata CBS 506.65]|uniref:Uncharacterized protein n=1 Tax=Penicilliopsis zonata CBS 506.65 TaxID=1073090 RepID=A0A1L9SJD3_9EURO|nr:hypothetical protein ASPZODRAFT_1945060 [Penicilliopsis zonata CBS 506.65]OJJ47330.1 hypothetical protein ASPZODRAFT_1945060 [Penicilliopsis zonata CBS 506.65]
MRYQDDRLSRVPVQSTGEDVAPVAEVLIWGFSSMQRFKEPRQSLHQTLFIHRQSFTRLLESNLPSLTKSFKLSLSLSLSSISCLHLFLILQIPYSTRTGKMAMSYELIVFLVILGCVAAVLIAYALHSHFSPPTEDVFPQPSHEQKGYMREVRERNIDALVYESRRIEKRNTADMC